MSSRSQMIDTSKSESSGLLDRKHLSKPPLRLVIPVVAISLLVVGAGTILVVAQNSGQTTPAGENTSTGDGSMKIIEVGYDRHSFKPAEATIQPGTTVKFVWQSDNHNIAVESQPEGADWKGHEQLENAGFSTTHTFTTNGTYSYYSEPYEALGMIGKIVVGQPETPENPSMTPDEPNSDDSESQTNNSAESGNETGSNTVVLGSNGELGFEPSGDEPLVVKSGTTVTFEWEAAGAHNIVVEEQPEGADWEGHESMEESGYTTTHTFGETGVYEFYCEPHEGAGATGTIVVVGNNSST